MKKSLKFFVVSSEVAPYSKTGGLADVARSLSKALFRLGHQVVVATPFYECAIDFVKLNIKPVFTNISIEFEPGLSFNFDFLKGELLSGLPIYFIKQTKYFSRKKEFYGSSHENVRFALFDLACLVLLKLIDFRPDVIQCHEWHSGLVPYFLNKKLRFNSDPFYQNIASIFTIHNLTFQLGHNWWEVPLEGKDDGHRSLPSLLDPSFENINFAKRGIIYSTLINTVSEQYAKEILTAGFGQDLHRILQNSQDRLFGIINGIDYFDYNPFIDPGLKIKYDLDHLNKKRENKIYLQKKFKLQGNLDIPLISMVSRITEQKGFDLLQEIIEPLMRMDLQLVLWGGGDKHYEKFFRKWSKRYPKKFAVYLKFDPKQVTQVYAGSDMFLMPSRFEPCGLGQLISLRYGSIPIVRATGGLVDTISDFNPRTGRGNGFVFKAYDSRDLLVAISRAMETYKHKDVWRQLIEKAMRQSFSWEIPARKYVTLFRKAVKLVRENRNTRI